MHNTIVVLKTISGHRIQIRLRNARGQRSMVKTMLVTWIFSKPNHVSGPERFSRNRYASVVRGHAGPEIYHKKLRDDWDIPKTIHKKWPQTEQFSRRHDIKTASVRGRPWQTDFSRVWMNTYTPIGLTMNWELYCFSISEFICMHRQYFAFRIYSWPTDFIENKYKYK